MEIRYFDLCYRISGDFHQNIKDVLKPNYIPVDALNDMGIDDIMKIPVIDITDLQPTISKKSDLRLEILVCSCFRGYWFLFHFSGGKDWKNDYVNFLSLFF